MAITQSNAELVSQIFGGNTGAIPSGFKPGIPVALVLAPAGYTFTAANMNSQSAFITAVNALTQNAIRSSRGFPIYGLDMFKPETKKTTSQDTGMYQEKIYNFPPLWTWLVKSTQGNISNWLEFIQFMNVPGYGIFVIDSNGNWWGTQDSTGAGGLQCFTMEQFWSDGWEPMTVSTATNYPLSVQLASAQEVYQNFNYFCCPTLSATALVGLQNVICYNAPSSVFTAVTGTSSTDIVFLAKIGQNSADFIQTYGSALNATCFTAYDYTAGAAATISSATIYSTGIVVAGVTYYPVKATLSAPPTSAHVVGIGTAAPATVNGVIPRLWCVTETLQGGVDGQRQAVKTF